MRILMMIVFLTMSFNSFGENLTSLLNPNEIKVTSFDHCKTLNSCVIKIQSGKGITVSQFRVANYNKMHTKAIRRALDSFNRDVETAKTTGKLLKVNAPKYSSDEYSVKPDGTANSIPWLTTAVAVVEREGDKSQKLAQCQETLINFAANVYGSEGRDGKMFSDMRSIASKIDTATTRQN